MKSTDAASLIRDDVRALTAYRTRKEPCDFKLDANEVPWDLPSAVKREMARRLAERDLSRYPDLYGESVSAILAGHTGLPAERILVGNGSGELLALLLEATVLPGTEVLVPVPAFELYPALVRRVAATMVPVGPREDLALPMDELEAEVERNPRPAGE